MKCIEHSEMSCAMKHAGTETMNGSNETKQWNNEWVKWNKNQISLYFLNPCALPALPCFIWLTVLWGQEVREMWVWLKCRCNTDPWMWLAEGLVWTAPVPLHPAPGNGQAGKVRINSFPTVHQVTCVTVSLQCSARNQNTIQVIYSLHLKPCTGLTSGHQGFSQACLLAVTAQHLVPGRAWMHPWSQELCGTPGSCTVEIHSRVLGSCPESFPQVPQKVHQPQISIPHLVLAGSIPTVRDPGPGEQYLQYL